MRLQLELTAPISFVLFTLEARSGDHFLNLDEMILERDMKQTTTVAVCFAMVIAASPVSALNAVYDSYDSNELGLVEATAPATPDNLVADTRLALLNFGDCDDSWWTYDGLKFFRCLLQ